MRKKTKHSRKPRRGTHSNVSKGGQDCRQYKPVVAEIDRCVCGRPLADHYRITVRFVGCDGAERKRK